MIRINKINTKKVTDAFKKYGDEALVVFEDAIFEEATLFVQKAKRNAPIDQGTLINSLKWDKISNLHYDVGTNLEYAPYMEFGTGAKVKIPAEFSDMANKAKGKGKGSFKEGLESIKRWCHLHGIDEKFAYIIFVNILNNGIEAKPFMYPAYVEAKTTFNKRIKDELKILNKKFNNG